MECYDYVSVANVMDTRNIKKKKRKGKNKTMTRRGKTGWAILLTCYKYHSSKPARQRHEKLFILFSSFVLLLAPSLQCHLYMELYHVTEENCLYFLPPARHSHNTTMHNIVPAYLNQKISLLSQRFRCLYSSLYTCMYTEQVLILVLSLPLFFSFSKERWTDRDLVQINVII